MAALTSQSSTPARSNFVQPLPILMLTFGGYTTESHDFFFALVPYFTAVQIMGGDTLWKQHDPADGLYLIESGCLRATYSYDDHSELVQETMVSGTVAGELSMLSDTPRNATVVAEKDSRLWKLDRAGLERMEGEKPGIARKFVMIVLKCESPC
jgi:SulP family sulfate permease